MIKAIDFFCGGGGMSLGLSEAGLSVIAGIDNDPVVERTYSNNHKDAVFLLRDVAKLSPSELKDTLGVEPDDDNLLMVGCSPCQYWSLINTDRKKSKKTAFLLDHFQIFIEYFNPGFVLIENVPGMTKRHGSPLNGFKCRLKEMGYKYDEGILDCSDFGVPQRRHRYVLLASRVNNISLPEKTSTPRKVVREAIGDPQVFPPIHAGHIDTTTHAHSTAGLSARNLKRIRATPKDGGDRLAWKDNPDLQLEAYVGKDDYFRDVYARLYWDRPAPTITTKFISYSNGRFGHPEQDRALSLREGATLQTFPLDYKICTDSIGEGAKIIGNAVPPAFAHALGECVVRSAYAAAETTA